MGFLSNLFGSRTPRVNLEKRFQKLAEAGTGSMCKIYRARDLSTGKIICLKILDKARTERLLAKDPQNAKRPSEGEVAVSLRHPNVVQTFEHGVTTTGDPFIVMEFIDGIGLNFLIDSGAQALQGKRIDYLVQAAEGLAYFHSQNFIHRDVCPRNILVGNDGVVRLIDFGLAVPNTPEFRRPGNRTGSATHMAPELIRRSRTDERIDVFSFGVTAYECIVGKPPWEAVDTLERLRAHMNNPPADPRDFRPDLDEQVCQLLLKGVAQAPDKRIPSMKRYAEALKGLERTDY